VLHSLLLAVHISAGFTGLLSGAAALIFRKGSPRHARAGQVFVAAMLTMGASAVWLAVLTHDKNNLSGGILTFYLILTAWLTARRPDGRTSRFDWFLLAIPLALGALFWIMGARMARAGFQEGTLYVGMSFFMGSMMLLAGAGDLRMLLRGGIAGRARVVRHLWRMCLGFFIATGSFFLGQGSKMFPSVLHQSNWLFIPAFLPLLVLLIWLFRMRFTNVYKRMFLPA